MATSRNWKRLLRQQQQLLLSAACDALTAKLIEQAGFPASPYCVRIVLREKNGERRNELAVSPGAAFLFAAGLDFARTATCLARSTGNRARTGADRASERSSFHWPDWRGQSEANTLWSVCSRRSSW
jgi:hypothetical protein